MYVIFFIFFIVISISLNFMILTQKGKMLEMHDFYNIKNKNNFFFNILKNNLTYKVISILSLFFFFINLVLCNLMIAKK